MPELKNQITAWLLGIGLAASIVANLLYFWMGFGGGVFFSWFVGIIFSVAAFVTFSDLQKIRKLLNWRNLAAVSLLLAVFAPFYLYRLWQAPWQINTDEIVIMSTAKRLLHTANVDLLALSDYFGFPTLIFVVFGWLAERVGGIDLAHFRLVHALSGLGIIALAYAFFSQLTTRFRAIIFTVILGSSHALLGLSRMAMRDNTGLFLELLALTLAVFGVKQKSYLATVMSGIAAGFGFYTYFPARIVPFIWLATLALLAFVYRKQFLWKDILTEGGIFFLGFFLVATPVLLATLQTGAEAFQYQKQQFLFYEEGRKLEMEWTGKTNGKDAWMTNIKNGLAMFNNKLHDQGYIYPNYKHGFVDPVTGIFLWLGVLIILFRLWKGEEYLAGLLVLCGFLILYLSFAFLITKAPNYTRLLVILPFSSFLAGSGLLWLSEKFSSIVPRRFVLAQNLICGSLIVFGTATIVVLNFNIFNEFALKGLKEGNDVGSTGRYIERVSQNPEHKFYLAASAEYMYYSWSNKDAWHSWMVFFVQHGNTIQVLEPTNFISTLPANGHFTVFMNRALFEQQKNALFSAQPKFKLVNMKTNGSLVAVEVE